MLNKIRFFLKRKGIKVRDLAPITLIDTIGGNSGNSNAGLSVFSWILIALVGAGVIFAIVKIIKISQKKKMAQVQ